MRIGVRLSDITSGRLFISRDLKNWGTVCDDNFDVVDARVVCQSIFGMHANGKLVPSSTDQIGDLPRILMDEVDCKGHENSIFECGFKELSNCDHSEDVSLICTGVAFDDYRCLIYNS